MFKKSEEQEWTRFRGALSKDRDETSGEQTEAATTAAAGSAQAPAASAPISPASPSLRSSASDVNVTVPSRLSRNMGGDSQDVESLIGERTTFEGTLKCEGSVRVLGTLQGEIQSKGTIIVEERAHVTARLTGAQISIAGHVDGQVYCEGRVEIRPTGHVTGEISAGALIVQEGAFFDGNSKMAVPSSNTSHQAGSDHAPGAANARARASEAPASA
jgi:cytoskeletal protein CcmA (bactofilin family)